MVQLNPVQRCRIAGSPTDQRAKKEVNTMTTSNSTTSVLIDSAETLGTPFPYASQATQLDIPNTRIVTCCYQLTDAMKAKGTAKRDNVFYRIPTTHLTEQILIDSAESLAPFVLAYLQSVEDEEIKAYHKKGGIDIHTTAYTLERIQGILEERGKGGSIDSAQVTEWFITTVALQLTENICLKNFSCSAKDMKEGSKVAVATAIEGYLAGFISLAGGKTKLSAAQRAKLTAGMESAGVVDSLMGQRFIKKFASMAAKELEDANALGDYEV